MTALPGLASVWDDVVGQPNAVAHLRRAAADPVHAYLFVGPSGSTKHEAARAFAAAVLSGDDDPGGRDARLALAGAHPDVREVERSGPFVTKPQAEDIVHWAALAPVEGARKVLLLHEFHLVQPEAAARAAEDDRGATCLDHVRRAGRLRAPAADHDRLALRADRLPHHPRRRARGSAAGRGRRRRDRRQRRRRGWRRPHPRPAALPAIRHSSSAGGRSPSCLAASTAPGPRSCGSSTSCSPRSTARPPHSSSGRPARSPSSTPASPSSASAAAGASSLEERHKRELRRHRTDELRSGLAVLAGTYRDVLVAGGEPPARWPSSPPWRGSTRPSRRSARTTTRTSRCSCNRCSGRCRRSQAGSPASGAGSSTIGSSPRRRPTASSAASVMTARAKP